MKVLDRDLGLSTGGWFLFLFSRKCLDTAEETLNEGRAGVDLKELLLLCVLVHELVRLARLCV